MTQEIRYSTADANTGSAFQRDQMCKKLIELSAAEQRRNYLPDMVKGELLLAFSVTQPDSGTGLASL